jgi:uncharacterized protein YbbC (DUF1343 family)/CubicO group peptidase (beta-lactamase class C family)
MQNLRAFLIPLLVCLCSFTAVAEPKRDFSTADNVITDAIARHDIPGAVLLVGMDGRTIYKKAYGNRSLVPTVEPMTEDTVFDIASLTKSFTACAVLDLVRQGKVRFNDSVARYLPDFAQNGKQDITIRMLLTHHSGLAPDLDLSTPWEGKEEAYRRAMSEKLMDPPGSRFVYSDINYEVLGFLVEKVSGKTLPQAIEDAVLKPLKMEHTRFQPGAELVPKIAPTTPDEKGAMMRGAVHDPTARRMGGVAGHAGLYSTADDLARYAKAFISRKGFLTPELLEKMETPQQPPWSNEQRAFGWDIDSPFANNRGELFPAGSFGHTGYTGTSMWMDPSSKIYVILLTNSVHPKETPDSWGKVAIRGKLMNAVASILGDEIAKRSSGPITTRGERAAGSGRRPSDHNDQVLNGIDVLAATSFEALKGKRIGLLTNQTGVDRNGKRTIDVLAHADGVQLVKLFSVEHGIKGKQDDVNVKEQADEATGLPVVSVYGAGSKQRPTKEQLAGLDAVVIDIQDIGVRFYTYEGSTANFISAAAESNIEIFVLDRPDPLNGLAVQGPVTDAEDLWPNFPLPVPLRHGMTLGELAQFYNGERKVGAKLTVVPMQGWLRSDWFDSTGQPWIDPSPNMRSLSQAIVYPGVAMLEGYGGNISVGRGTDTPFEIVGAAYIPLEGAVTLAKYLNDRKIPGVRFVPRTFVPGGGYIFDKQICGGLNVVVIDRNVLDSPLLGAELLAAMVKFYPNDFHAKANRKLVGNQKVLDELIAGKDPKAVALEWRDEVEQFKTLRAKYLLYK